MFLNLQWHKTMREREGGERERVGDQERERQNHNNATFNIKTITTQSTPIIIPKTARHKLKLLYSQTTVHVHVGHKKINVPIMYMYLLTPKCSSVVLCSWSHEGSSLSNITVSAPLQ